jgi:predicted dehydrogenase
MKQHMTAELNRRDFLRGGSAAAFFTMLGGVPILAAEEQPGSAPTQYKGETPPVKVGVIGCGAWGREILKTLSMISFGPVVAICDNYPAYLKRGATLAPNAERYDDYTKLLASPEVEAVVVATPTHLHKEFVLAALAAGKHVYCEAPLATNMEDTRAIAEAARKHLKLNFQPGLQARADKQIVNLMKFVRTGVMGTSLKGRAQFHKKMSWRLASATAEREKALNWRLDSATSCGLVGEFGVHQVDLANWVFNAPPAEVKGVGAVTFYKDGRDVFDNIQALFRYPNGVHYSYEATVGNSFDGEMGLFFGTDCAIMMRERRAWMFKEADAPLLGWEVYAVKEAFYKESGISLRAGASKQDAQKEAAKGPDVVDEKSALQYALENFLINSYNLAAAVKDFADSYGEGSEDDLREFLKEQAKKREPAAELLDGYLATVAVLKANEALNKNQPIVLAPEWFQLG